MCGIYGEVTFSEPVDPRSLRVHGDRLAHRGPDDSGAWISACGRVGLAHRRLSIIDLTDAGHQPMSSEDGRCTIVYNGEVYNFGGLRRELEKTGCRFTGRSDTEVVLAAYRVWGEECVTRFNGMFALAIYDKGTKDQPPSLFLARDRAGKKPLYYLHGTRSFRFASELKALNAKSGIDARALNYYLALGYVPQDLCLALGVKKLPPACAARLDLHDHSLRVWRYWQLPDSAPDKDEADGDEIADQVQSLLDDAVSLRLISDVPVGVLLSGGLDSSLILASAARQSSLPVKTFTISLPGSRLDESASARSVADYYGTEHHVLEASTPSMAVIDEMTPFVDEPLGDSSILPSFMISRLARRHVTVALGGDGGDELFGGYTGYARSLIDQARIGRLPGSLLKAVSMAAARLPAGLRGRNRVRSLKEGALRQIIWDTPFFDVTLRCRIMNRMYAESLDSEMEAPERLLARLFDSGKDTVDSMTRMHFGSILPDDFLVKVDRAAMAHGLEMRTPFLDYRLVEFAFSAIPSRWKVAGRESRRVQRILARRRLPHDLDTGRKQGFSVPLDDWLRTDRCDTVREWSAYLPPCINRKEIDDLIQGEMKGRANGSRLFALLMLAIAARNNGWENNAP